VNKTPTINTFKDLADHVNLFFLENKEIWQIQKLLDDAAYGKGKFDCVLKRRLGKK